ncbi:MAG TPA: type II secretion system F family protein [Micavibrio sp.]|nr:type II secretion system F family protein [Pseudomonadota bacterium]MEC8664998.1 type II secretion system F family protein [Pseudomonadota bacterium]HIF26070.1 type II secretion system F family protein [Micavibrio sp.]HIL29202.1 type II secretion system F family protein [Micavibrio sp.]
MTDTLIILVSALAAALSFMAFALPMLNKTERKERYQSVIQKRRRDLFEQTKRDLDKKGTASMTAQESMATFFKAEQMLGKMGEKVRDQMLQAGIRSPSAPIKFIVASMVLPIFAVLLAMMFMSKSEDMSGGMKMFIMMGAAFAGYKLPALVIKNQIQKRTEEVNLRFPDALDLMLICVQGGIGLEQTVARIAEEMAEHSEVLAEELGILSAEMAMLNDRRQALQDFARRVGSGAAKSFATALIQAEQYGTSVSQAMRVMSDELRDMRMQEAERKAAALPPKLTVPMIAFFLPVLFIVILGPAVLEAMDSVSKAQ